MNIKQHLESGHYPKAFGGVTTVATRSGSIAYIYTTKHHPDWPIVGGIEGESEPYAWRPNGRIAGDDSDDPRDLLPPAPRKREVKAWASVSSDGVIRVLKVNKGHLMTFPGDTLIELTGSYEEEWK